ncbi:hypothetical protein [Chromohalobacter israelensis]|uniref:hypothetical protein n=1 Tax=Chromohalobacter israelensis TaxID=141390 RepID=UPI0016512C84|nr:hypothetical protein [Chromohalobacter salexigens]
MSQESKKNCTACGGTGVNKANLQDMGDDQKKGGIEYQPIECQPCKGTGKEPE